MIDETYINLVGQSCDRETGRRIINSRYIDTYVYIIGINDERILIYHNIILL